MADQPDKTEQPTPRRLSLARTKGQVPQGQELQQAISLVALLVGLAAIGPSIIHWVEFQIREGMSCNVDIFADSGTLMSFFNTRIIESTILILPVFAIIIIGSVLSSVIVSGPTYSPKAIRLRFEEINPATGFQRLFNGRAGVHLLFSIVKMVFIAFVMWQFLQSKIDEFAALRWAWSMQILLTISELIFGLMIRVCIALIVIGIIDTIYQKWKYIEQMKMTKQEVKEERRSEEGSPEIKSRIRRIQFEMALKRMIHEVPKADVIIVNPTHVAVAIRYDAKDMDCPVVLAKGADQLAEKIREIARAYGVPILRRPELARTIYSTVEPGQPIPPDLYIAVAEVLALIYRLKQKRNSG